MFVTTLINVGQSDATDFNAGEWELLLNAEAARKPVRVIGCAGPEGYFDVLVVFDGYEVEIKAVSGQHLKGYNQTTNIFSYK